MVKHISLYSEHQIENTVGGVGVPVRLLHLLDEHAEGEVELVRAQFQDICLKLLLILALCSELLQLGVLLDHPVLPRVYLCHKLVIPISNFSDPENQCGSGNNLTRGNNIIYIFSV